MMPDELDEPSERGYRSVVERWLRQDGWKLARTELQRRREAALMRLAQVDPHDAAVIGALQAEAKLWATLLADPITFLTPPKE